MESEVKEEPKATGLSFGFAKKSATKLKDSALRDVTTKDVQKETDFVLEVTDSRIKGSIKPEVKKELVIPCLGNTYKLNNKSNKAPAPPVVKKEAIDSGLSEEDRAAAQALIDDSKAWEQAQEEDDQPNANLVIPSQTNEVLDDKAMFEADLETRPEVASQDDYDSTPVEGFGMAMLRGMGFKREEGVGGFKKEVVKCIEPELRPKGLGLGAVRPGDKNKSKDKKSQDEEDLELRRGAYVYIESGQHKKQYGQVDGLDEENARVVVKLAVGSSVVSLSENVIKLVTKKEYRDYGKVLNKESYDKYRIKQEERQKEWDRDRGDRDSTKEKSSKDKDRKRNYDNDDRESKNGHSNSSSKRSRKSRPWIRPQLRVRIVDDRSKYYKEKVIVEDVISPEEVVCRTERGRMLEGILSDDCETVVPKEDGGIIMIVKGDHCGKIAEILRKDSKRAVAAVQVLPDKSEVLKMDYDDICQFVGDLTEYL